MIILIFPMWKRRPGYNKDLAEFPRKVSVGAKSGLYSVRSHRLPLCSALRVLCSDAQSRRQMINNKQVSSCKEEQAKKEMKKQNNEVGMILM